MSTTIPEIRIYSPTDKGNGSERAEVLGPPTVNGGISSIRSLNAHDHINRRSSLLTSVVLKVKSEMPAVQNSSLSPGMVRWENTFHMRPFNLSNFPTSATTYRTLYRSQAVAMQRAKLGCISGSAKSLDILRQNIQKYINKEIDEILQKYLETFFRPGIENIKLNNGGNSVSEQHVQTVCRQILEEAKKMYQVGHTRGGSPADCSDTENSSLDVKIGRIMQKSPARKRKDSDTDSEASLNTFRPKKKKGRPPIHGTLSGRSTPSKLKTADQVKREGPKWDPSRLTPETRFIMGAKANKALGLGATRGRLYIKHPEIFKYSGDQEDKQWLHEHNLMPATGGKAYMLLIDDIRELAQSDEYCNNPALMLEELVGFTIPETMLQKMRITMQSMRTDLPAKKRGRPPVNADSSSDRSVSQVDIKLEDIGSEDKQQGESGAPSPTDDLDLLSAEMPSTDPSPFSLGPGFEDVSPAHPEVSPTPSDLSATLEPPLSAPFDISPST